MDKGLKTLANAITSMAEGFGHAVVVNQPDVPEDAFFVSLGRNSPHGPQGRAVMLRKGLACEGRRTTLNHPDIAEDATSVPPATMAWLTMWAMGLSRVTGYRDGLRRDGLADDAVMPRRMIIGAVANRIAAACGRPLAGSLTTLGWEATHHGFTAHADSDTMATFHRYLEELTMTDMPIGTDDLPIMASDLEDGTTSLWVRSTDILPETTLAACVGRDLGDLIELPGIGRRAGATIRRAEHRTHARHGPGMDVIITRRLEMAA